MAEKCSSYKSDFFCIKIDLAKSLLWLRIQSVVVLNKTKLRRGATCKSIFREPSVLESIHSEDDLKDPLGNIFDLFMIYRVLCLSLA